MTLHPYQQHRMPEEQVEFAAAYPFARPSGSYLFATGSMHPLRSFDLNDMASARLVRGGESLPLDAVLSDDQIRALVDEPRWPVIASGSNASPEQLARKYPDGRHSIPTIRVAFRDFAIVYSAHITAYGSIAATIQHVPGSISEAFVNFLTAEQLEMMHATESLGRDYDFGRLDDVDVTLDLGGTLSSVWAYITLPGCLAKDGRAIALSAVTQSSPGIDAMDQKEVLDFARTLLEPASDFHSFVRGQITDPAVRHDREHRLQTAHTVPFSYPYTT